MIAFVIKLLRYCRKYIFVEMFKNAYLLNFKTVNNNKCAFCSEELASVSDATCSKNVKLV